MKVCKECQEAKSIEEYGVYFSKLRGREYTNTMCGDCYAEYSTARYRANNLKTNYNMTIEQYNQLLEDQGHVCGICSRPETMFARRLHVDHDHNCCPEAAKSCGKCIRGLICHGCNTGLGSFNDDIELLFQSEVYLLKYTNVIGKVA